MNAAKIRKSLEYIDKFVSLHEISCDSYSEIVASDARKGLNYLKFVLSKTNDINEQLDDIEETIDTIGRIDTMFKRARKLIDKEPKDSHLL
jgi:hypothetical protein